jgi:hypothetical protein
MQSNGSQLQRQEDLIYHANRAKSSRSKAVTGKSQPKTALIAQMAHALDRSVLEFLGALVASDPFGSAAEPQPTVIVILAGTQRTNYSHGILVNCVITEWNKDMLEITCAD